MVQSKVNIFALSLNAFVQKSKFWTSIGSVNADDYNCDIFDHIGDLQDTGYYMEQEFCMTRLY